MSRTIAFVVTSHQTMGPWLEELAAPYMYLRDKGFTISIVSPDGGAAVLDPTSVEDAWRTPVGDRFLADAQATAQLADTGRVDQVDASSLAAIYLVGGTGTMWDFPDCQALGDLVTELTAQGKPVSAICHGVSGLLSARAADGTPLVKGRSLTCFTDAEETMVEMHEVVPLLAETALRKQGALFSNAGPFEAHVVDDGLLLTGQNPASAPPLAEQLAAKLG